MSVSAKMRLMLAEKGEFQLDAISIGLIFLNVLLSTYLIVVSTNLNMPDVAFKSIVMVMLTLAGVVCYLMLFGERPKIDWTLTQNEVFNIFSTAIAGFLAILVLQTVSVHVYKLFYASVSDVVTLKLLLVNVAIGEEVFFRLFLQSALTKQIELTCPRDLAALYAVIGASCVFSVYHYIYYNVPGTLLAVFASSIILGAVYAATRRLSVPMIAHIVVNLL